MKWQIVNNAVVRRYTIKEILSAHWYHFLWEMEAKGKAVRKVIQEEVEKIMWCQSMDKGFTLYECPNCHEKKVVPFTCKSRFCNTCGAKYSQDRSLSISSKLIYCEHRHVVFTIPEELRPYFAHDRTLLNKLFEAAADTINFFFRQRNKSEAYTPGFISVLHTFGRDLKWNPHIHMILCTEAAGKSGGWKNFTHINYAGLRKSWQFCLLRLLSEKITHPSFKQLVDKLYSDHSNGFYVNAPPIKHFNAGIINYIVRYAGRPVLAQSRIKDYDGKNVTFTYTPHGSDELVTETVTAYDFIKRLIIHIPDRNFKMIRYYGFYSCKHKAHAQYKLREKRVGSSDLKSMRDIYKSWRKRIKFSFRYDPLRCICGSYFVLADKFISWGKIKDYMRYNTS
jgi:hypothetical protein